ncbi:MAG: NUDIX domain-containing protein [Bacteroidota bacterium]
MQDLINHNNKLACYLILEREGKILLLLRSNTGFEDGKYSFISGKIEPGESLLQSAIREAWEEAGITVKKEEVSLVHTLHRQTADQQTNWVDFFFKAENWSGEIVNKEPHKCGGLHWFDRNELPENTVGYIRNTLAHTLNGVSYDEMDW